MAFSDFTYPAVIDRFGLTETTADLFAGVAPIAPSTILVVIEAKRDNIENGFGQCIAGMVGIQRFNQSAGRPSGPVFGGITTGFHWKFLRLDETSLTYDQRDYSIQANDFLLGALCAMIDTLLAAHP